MTAYGRANEVINGKDTLVEIKSVNNRFFDCTVKISKYYGFLEEKIKTYLQQNGVSRGKVDVYAGINVIENIGEKIHLDEAYAKSYIDALCRLRDAFDLKDDISVMTVAQNHDVFIVLKPEEDMEKDWQELLPVLRSALNAFCIMREAEGDNLRRDLIQKKERLMQLTAKIASLQANSVIAYRTRLESRLRQVLAELDINISPDDSRIITECAIFADKTAVDEELTRLGSHFCAFDLALESNEPVGRKIDFLLQEMNREVNTIGSKVSDIEITTIVVDMKSELEKIREQIQNIE
jgi:uncharacterized protein (TIGR00255 family)